MKVTCKECKTVIQMADSENVAAILADLLAAHIRKEHESVEVRHAKTLEACRSAFFVLMSGGKIIPKHAKQLHDQVSDLLKVPHIFIQGEKTDANVSVIPVIDPVPISSGGEKDVSGGGAGTESAFPSQGV